MHELRPGVWHWQSSHPAWNEEEWWPELVSSYAIEAGDDVLLFDPLRVPDELRARATAVVLTAPYHERDARRLGLPVHTPPADTWEDWVEKFGIDPDRVRGMESEDLAWLRAGEGEGHFHGPGAWPFGISAYAGREDNDLHPLAAVDQRDRERRLARRLRRWTGHPARRSQARDARRCCPTAPSAAQAAGRARAARAWRADGSRGTRARSFLSGAAGFRGSGDVAPPCATVLSSDRWAASNDRLTERRAVGAHAGRPLEADPRGRGDGHVHRRRVPAEPLPTPLVV